MQCELKLTKEACSVIMSRDLKQIVSIWVFEFIGILITIYALSYFTGYHFEMLLSTVIYILWILVFILAFLSIISVHRVCKNPTLLAKAKKDIALYKSNSE